MEHNVAMVVTIQKNEELIKCGNFDCSELHAIELENENWENGPVLFFYVHF